jgi:hypothetical protein
VVQVKTELSERELSRLERQLENLDSPLLDSAEIMKNLGDQGDVLLKDIDTYS